MQIPRNLGLYFFGDNMMLVTKISSIEAECAIINSGELTEDQLNCRIANETDGLIRSVRIRIFQTGRSNRLALR